MRTLLAGFCLLHGCKSAEPRVQLVPIVVPIVVTPSVVAKPSPAPTSRTLQPIGPWMTRMPQAPPPTREFLVLSADLPAACAPSISFDVAEPSAVSTVMSTNPDVCRRLASGTGKGYFAAELEVQTHLRVECEPVNAIICHVTGTYAVGSLVRLVPARGRPTAELMRIALALDVPLPGTITVR